MQIAYQVNIFSSLAAAAAANCCDAVSDKLYLESCLVRLSIVSRAAVRYYTYNILVHTVRSPDWPINLATRKVQSAAVRPMIYGRLSLRGLVLVLLQQLN